jgi:hypothetical protein
MSKEFSELNGYGVKDAVARAEIETLKQGGGGGKLYEHQVVIKLYDIDDIVNEFYVNIISTNQESVTVNNLEEKTLGKIAFVRSGGNTFIGKIAGFADDRISLNPVFAGNNESVGRSESLYGQEAPSEVTDTVKEI